MKTIEQNTRVITQCVTKDGHSAGSREDYEMTEAQMAEFNRRLACIRRFELASYRGC